MKVMKKELMLITVCLFLASCIFPTLASAQCNKKKYCAENFGDYDYNSQSSFASLAPGDTSRANVVLYANQTYRIFVCADPSLGDVKYQVILPERKTSRRIDQIKKDTVVTYKTDEYGEYMYDDLGNMVVQSKTVVVDTTWITERFTFEKVLYDNKNNKSGKPYFEYAPKKSGRLQVKIQVPGGDPENQSCVNIYVGRKVIGSKNFQKQARYNEN
ncbi:MAG: hypothetical protein CVU05_06725 [Bacteroidetes bacterium HGW-Bacteroidetes-21]|jgi:hypothetical protein|nr:MAG: hypothetical protein CVU05_06725 [Bacteroidetes bacterium HGW-Bacteroidetes-21]